MLFTPQILVQNFIWKQHGPISAQSLLTISKMHCGVKMEVGLGSGEEKCHASIRFCGLCGFKYI